MSGSSFTKKKKVVYIPGTKLSVYNSQLLASSGIDSLDNLTGGGIPVGSIVLIEEDFYKRFGDIVLKSFVAEGVYCGQYIHMVSSSGSEFIENLPAKLVSSASVVTPNDDEKMRIAWRYQKQKDNEKISDSFGNKFNYASRIKLDDIPNDLIYIENTIGLNGSQLGNHIIASIREQIIKRGVLVGSHSKANLLRIVIPSLGTSFDSDLTKMIAILKSLVRNSFSIAMIVVSANTTDNILCQLNDIADMVIKLIANQDLNYVNPLYKDFDGIMTIKKVPIINTLIKPPHIKELGFKLYKNKFKLSKLHLPPDLSEMVNRTTSKPMCNLEF